MTQIGSSAVKAAVLDLLQNETLQAAVGGRLYDSLPDDVSRPCVLYDVSRNDNQSGLGPSHGPFQKDFRTYVFSDIGSLSEADSINDLIVNLLSDARLAISGFSHCGTVRYWETPEAQISLLSGVKVHEVASNFTLWVEES